MRELKGKSLIEIPNKYIAFDIETTGLDPMYDEIIEIGAIKIEDGKEIETFSTLIKPEYEYPFNTFFRYFCFSIFVIFITTICSLIHFYNIIFDSTRNSIKIIW